MPKDKQTAKKAQTNSSGKFKPAPKRKKKLRRPPLTGRAAKIIKKRRGDNKAAFGLHLATRGDLTLLELRIALYLTVIGSFEKLIKVSGAKLGVELGGYSNHISNALKGLVEKGVLIVEAEVQPYSYKLKRRKDFST